MKKQELVNLWKKNWLKIKDINDIILKTTWLTKIQLFLTSEIDEKYIKKIQLQFSQKLNWFPIEYITNKAEFYWLDFFVDNRVLIPRNDTEIMVEQVLKYINPPTHSSFSPLTRGIKGDFLLIDVWTWSWAIPISIIKNSNKIEKCFATEISKKALQVSKINVNKYLLTSKITLLQWNLLDVFELDTNLLCPSWDINLKNLIITANLPYIKDNNISDMDKEVILFEPPVALYWWKETWFELYEKLIYQCLEITCIYNIDKFYLYIEIWFDQYEYSKKYLKSKKLKFESFKDNNWINRCIKIEF